MPITPSFIMAGITTFILDKIKDKGFDSLYSKLTSKNTIETKFIASIEMVSDNLQKKYPDILGGRIDFFFKNENVFKELFRLLFKNSNINIDEIERRFDLSTLPPDFIKEFILELKNELQKDREIEEILANKELFVLICGINDDVETIRRNSDLTTSEISEIKTILEQRIGERFLLREFLSTYSKNALNTLSQINFIGLGVGVDMAKKINRKNLQDIFVKPKFELERNLAWQNMPNRDAWFENDFIIEYESLFELGPRLVILGNPGSGKSMVIKSMMCSILVNEQNVKIETSFKYLPFRIELRKYLAYKNQYRGNITKYLSSLLEEEYGTSSISPNLLEKILREHKNIIFFDGLDEIFKIEDKIDIKNDIENFHNAFPNSKSVTTSRIIGYEEAKLNEESFLQLSIQGFDDDQIEEYLTKWYEKEEDQEEIRSAELKGFLDKKHEVDHELISNPLLLSLIVIIYRNTLTLPDSKLEIYESCTKTLVEKWDSSKKLMTINIDPALYKKRENILAELAFWQYQQLSGENNILTFEKALGNVATTIEKLKIAEESESYLLAERFMEYAQRRSIYFENNFTHKTFLEYYAAFWIYSNLEKKNKTDERNQLISKYIDNPFWQIVLELLLNMIDKNQADSEMMDGLIEFQLKRSSSSIPFFLSTINSYKNVSPESIDKILGLAIELLLVDYDLEKFNHPESLYSKTYRLLNVAYDNPIFKGYILGKLRELEHARADLLELIYTLYCEIEYARDNDDRSFTFELSDQDKFNGILSFNKLIQISTCYTLYKKECDQDYTQTVVRFIKSFGPESALSNVKFSFTTSRWYLPIIHYYFVNQIKSVNHSTFENNLELLVQNGISIESLVSYCANNRVYINDDTIDDLLGLISDDYNKTVNAISTLILFGDRGSLLKMRIIASEHLKGDYFIELLNLSNQKSRLEKILYDYGFEGVKVDR